MSQFTDNISQLYIFLFYYTDLFKLNSTISSSVVKTKINNASHYIFSAMPHLLHPAITNHETNISGEFLDQAVFKNTANTFVNLTVDGKGCLHARVDVVCHMAMKEPRSRSSCYQFDSLKCPGEQVVDVGSVGVIRLREERRDINYRVYKKKKKSCVYNTQI